MGGSSWWGVGYASTFSRDISRIANALEKLDGGRVDADQLIETYVAWRDHAKVDSEPMTILIGFDPDVLASNLRVLMRFGEDVKDALAFIADEEESLEDQVRAGRPVGGELRFPDDPVSQLVWLTLVQRGHDPNLAANAVVDRLEYDPFGQIVDEVEQALPSLDASEK